MATFDYDIIRDMTAVTTAGTTHIMYTNPSSTTSFIRQIWIHAPTGGLTDFSKATVQMYKVLDTGGSVGTARNPTNQFFERSFVTNETYILDCGIPGIILGDANDTLQMVHTSKTTFTYQVYGGYEV